LKADLLGGNETTALHIATQNGNSDWVKAFVEVYFACKEIG